MTNTLKTPERTAPVARTNALQGSSLPKGTARFTLIASFVLVAVIFWFIAGAAESEYNFTGMVIIALALYVIAITTVSFMVEGGRKAKDRLMITLVTGAFGLAMLPLVSLLWTVGVEGWSRFDWEFLSTTMRGELGAGGGVLHAMVGTLLITLTATLISVPIGLFTSIYLVEYGRGALARGITFMVDVMTGIPSIVAGLFAYAIFSMILGPGTRSGLAGAVALSVLMIPVVVRSCEEMLRLVPNELREASLALGVPKWLTILKVVLPTSMAGITTGVIVAIARVIGETAPLLVVAGFTYNMNWDMLSGRMMTLPVFVYDQYKNQGLEGAFYDARAWSGALVLILIVMLMNLGARMISKALSPKLNTR